MMKNGHLFRQCAKFAGDLGVILPRKPQLKNSTVGFRSLPEERGNIHVRMNLCLTIWRRRALFNFSPSNSFRFAPADGFLGVGDG